LPHFPQTLIPCKILFFCGSGVELRALPLLGSLSAIVVFINP
jgi:hypothetical protein